MTKSKQFWQQCPCYTKTFFSGPSSLLTFSDFTFCVTANLVCSSLTFFGIESLASIIKPRKATTIFLDLLLLCHNQSQNSYVCGMERKKRKQKGDLVSWKMSGRVWRLWPLPSALLWGGLGHCYTGKACSCVYPQVLSILLQVFCLFGWFFFMSISKTWSWQDTEFKFFVPLWLLRITNHIHRKWFLWRRVIIKSWRNRWKMRERE